MVALINLDSDKITVKFMEDKMTIICIIWSQDREHNEAMVGNCSNIVSILLTTTLEAVSCLQDYTKVKMYKAVI